MNQSKGFSLIEVLASLIFIASVACILIEHQQNFRYLLKQLLLTKEAFLPLNSEKELVHTLVSRYQ